VPQCLCVATATEILRLQAVFLDDFLRPYPGKKQILGYDLACRTDKLDQHVQRTLTYVQSYAVS
jgi:hypothetical protein